MTKNNLKVVKPTKDKDLENKEKNKALDAAISQIKDNFGKVKSNNKKILIEYVSSNPTGPLHVGHGRGAVFGSVLS